MMHDDAEATALHDALAARLTADLRPVRRIWSPWVRLALWVMLSLATVGLAAVVGLRDDLRAELDRARFPLALAILLAGGGLAATAALLAAVPGRIAGRQARRITVGLLLLAVTAALLGDPSPSASPIAFVITGLRCAVCVGAFGLLPWAALFWAVSRGAPLDGRTTGACIGAAAFLVGAAAVHVACPIDDPLHLAVWHGVPVALWVMASAVTGGVWLSDLRRVAAASAPVRRLGSS